MRFEILTEQDFNRNFGSFEKSEKCWKETDESVVDLLLSAKYKEDKGAVKNQILNGKSIPSIVGFIRKKTDLEKCPLCGSSFEESLFALSIVDSETRICPDCGTREQMEMHLQSYER